MRACSGTWIAHGSGSADRETVDRDDRVAVPPEHPIYQIRRIWLTPEEENGYYAGFANEGLWPLCHIAHVRPTFRSSDFEHYRTVNARFADAVVAEVEDEGSGGPGAGLSLRAAAADDPRPAARRDDHHVLAHPVAESGGLRHLPVAQGTARRASRQQHHRLSHAVPLQQLSRYRRPPARGARRPRIVHDHVAADNRPPCIVTRSRSSGHRRRSPRPRASATRGARCASA